MSKFRSWCFTVNNFAPAEYEKLQDVDCKYIIIGMEKGKEGTPHLQGYVQFKNQKRLSEVKNICERAHWEQAKGSPQQNYDYCSKEGHFWEKGVLPKNGKRSMEERAALNKRLKEEDLEALADEGVISFKEIRAIKNARYDLQLEKSAKTTDDTRGVWLYGKVGRGKTHWAIESLKKQFGDKGIYYKEENKWWEGYKGQPAVLLDDLSKGNHLGQKLKRWLDKYEAFGEPKGGQVPLQHEVFLITSNYWPEEIWEDDPQMAEAIRDRCQMIDFKDIYDGPSRRKKAKVLLPVEKRDVDLEIVNFVQEGDEYVPE